MNLSEAVSAYAIYARAGGLSERTVEWVRSGAHYLDQFLGSIDPDIRTIKAATVRNFILALGKRGVWAKHPFNKPLDRRLSPHTVSCYIRSLKALFSFLAREDYLPRNPLARVKAPKVTVKEMPVLTVAEIKKLLATINKKTAVGYRDYAIIVTFLDNGVRVSGLCGMDDADVRLESGYLRVMGKGGREQLVPIGFKCTKALLKYRTTYRPEFTAGGPFFTSRDGSPLNRNRIGAMIRKYARLAGITGKRVSAHTFRSTMAVMFLRNGGDPFSLQKILGHTNLAMTRRYCAIADTDVKEAHKKFGVVDRLCF